MKRAVEEHGIVRVPVAEFAEHNGYEVLNEGRQYVKICSLSINRPGLMLAGYESYFAVRRVQVIGSAERDYLRKLTPEARLETLDKFFGKGIPCVILSRGYKPSKEMYAAAEKYRVPIFSTDKITADVMSALGHYLDEVLADTDSFHGILLDIFGTGVMITGSSGIGKSETALELLHRGHRLVADDRVDVSKKKGELFGKSPDVIKHFLEIRGVGIIDVKAIYGVGAVLSEKKLELVIELERWDDKKEYERIGADFKTEEIMGVSVPKLLIPVEAGRNIAIVIEVAVMDFRLKQQGYNSAKALNERLLKQTD